MSAPRSATSITVNNRIAFLIFTIVAGNVIAQEVPETAAWTPELSMEFRRVQGTAMSPDGSHIAYQLSTPLMEGDKSEFLTQIWVAATDGSFNRQYTQSQFSATAPAFSPDGQYLSFSSKRGAGADVKSQVWVMPILGGEARQLTNAAEDPQSYKWSPDGSRIAFTMQEPLSAERKQQVTEKRDVIIVDQQPRYAHLYVVPTDLDTDNPKTPLQLTSGEMVVGDFDWSPAGDKIVFAHKPRAELDDANMAGDLSVVTVPGAEELVAMQEDHSAEQEAALRIVGSTQSLIAGNGVEDNPYWSPDGNWIAFTSSGTQPNLIGLGDVYVIPAGGGDSRQLAQTPNRSPNIVDWSANSDELFLLETMGTKRAVIGLPLRGDAIRSLTPEIGVVGSVSMASANDSLVFSWETADTPWDLYARTTDNPDNLLKITNLHSRIDLPPMGRTELLSWASPDGTQIEGLLTYPVDYIEGRSYPIILNVHGGPSGVFAESFTGGPDIYMVQYFAQHGFAVLRPNPRGSTGYGYEFRQATATNWGDDDLQDLLAGLDLVINRGIGDAGQQFLMGWSYGGYMTSWTVTQTDRFKAASMGAGITNLMSMSMTSDIRRYLVEHMGDYYWNDMEAYRKSSALHHIQNVVTPTQIIHGADDVRVPTSQGQEFYNALRYRGIDTEMIIYPRTPHSVREPKFLMDVSPRILAWFNKYRVEQ